MTGEFVPGIATCYVYTKDGTLVFEFSTDFETTITVTEYGAEFDSLGNSDTYIYDGNKVFLGFTDRKPDINTDVAQTYVIGQTYTINGRSLIIMEGDLQINITDKGTTTLATAGKYCDRNIDINTDLVYAAGQDDYWENFWNTFQYNGKQTYCPYLFAGYGWRDGIFKPKYDIRPKGSADGIFRQTRLTNLTKCLTDAGVVLDTSEATSLTTMFGYSGWLTHIPKISLISVTNKTTYMFANNVGASVLERIEEIEVAATTIFQSSTFANCDNLEHVIFTGTLATNGLDLHWSTKLDKESLISIINILQDKTSAGGTWTVTLGEENLAKLTDEEKAVATQKGWTLA